jgi:antitoxin FitA
MPRKDAPDARPVCPPRMGKLVELPEVGGQPMAAHSIPVGRICAIIDSNMAQLIVRNIPQQVVVRLKQRAARRGHSAEAEHREILKQALLSPRVPSLKAMLSGIPDVGRDSDFGRPRRQGRRVVL